MTKVDNVSSGGFTREQVCHHLEWLADQIDRLIPSGTRTPAEWPANIVGELSALIGAYEHLRETVGPDDDGVFSILELRWSGDFGVVDNRKPQAR